MRSCLRYRKDTDTCEDGILPRIRRRKNRHGLGERKLLQTFFPRTRPKRPRGRCTGARRRRLPAAEETLHRKQQFKKSKSRHQKRRVQEFAIENAMVQWLEQLLQYLGNKKHHLPFCLSTSSRRRPMGKRKKDLALAAAKTPRTTRATGSSAGRGPRRGTCTS